MCYNHFMNQKQVIDLIKRFLIVFLLICVPLVVVLTLCTKLSSPLVITIAVIVCGLAFGLVEYIYHIRLKKKQERREKYKKDK